MAGTEVLPSMTVEMLLSDRFRDVRRQTETLVEPLTAEDLMVQSCPEASPVKWHLAHSTWFFETFVLREFDPGYRSFDSDFHWLFNSYYKSLGEHPEKRLRSSFSRPSLEHVWAYRRHVEQAILRMLKTGASTEASERIELGMHHEQQHQELIVTDIKHAFWSNPLQPAYIGQSGAARSWAGESAAAANTNWLRVPGGLLEFGHLGDGFAFDNELPRHRVYLEPFRLAARPVSCAEYLEFINENGYCRPELWLSEGWDTIQAQGWRAPLYWHRDAGSEWSVYTLESGVPLRELAATPVCHVSYYEADAYARWAGCRLPTEYEWEQAASTLSIRGNFLEDATFHPLPSYIKDGTQTELQQMFGDVWEWTASAYLGYPGYRPAGGALGEYNGKFMSNQMVLRGGSVATPRSHVRATYRNFFSPATRWQFSGIRLADGANA